MQYTQNCSKQINELKASLEAAEALLIGAGSGLSASAGLTYSGERFFKYFSDFHTEYGITDMYSGGFYPFGDLETFWGWWSRQIYYNRYEQPPLNVYKHLLSLVESKNYFVITTNVDHCFQNAGFDKERLFYTQGDYGLLQCSAACHDKTYANEELIRRMVKEQRGVRVPSELIPYCPICGRPMTTNLRTDDKFVQDEGWYAAHKRYKEFLETYKDKHLLLLELGVGFNTPVIIKYPFWEIARKNKQATYVCVNKGDLFVPKDIEKQTICMDFDIGELLEILLNK